MLRETDLVEPECERVSNVIIKGAGSMPAEDGMHMVISQTLQPHISYSTIPRACSLKLELAEALGLQRFS